jgi:hypothetical protein
MEDVVSILSAFNYPKNERGDINKIDGSNKI